MKYITVVLDLPNCHYRPWNLSLSHEFKQIYIIPILFIFMFSNTSFRQFLTDWTLLCSLTETCILQENLSLGWHGVDAPNMFPIIVTERNPCIFVSNFIFKARFLLLGQNILIIDLIFIYTSVSSIFKARSPNPVTRDFQYKDFSHYPWKQRHFSFQHRASKEKVKWSWEA